MIDWVSVKTRLPEAHESVLLVWANKQSWKKIFYNQLDLTWMEYQSGGRSKYCKKEITHWLPYPSPPVFVVPSL